MKMRTALLFLVAAAIALPPVTLIFFLATSLLPYSPFLVPIVWLAYLVAWLLLTYFLVKFGRGLRSEFSSKKD